MADSETLVAAQTSGAEEDANRNEDQPMPDAQNPTDGSDSESDSDSDSEDEAQVKEQIEALETALYNNPSDYDSHVQYIRILRKQGDLEKLRQAREAMSLLFPLTPDMWQEWAKDETTVSSGVEAFHAVERLYERGVSDYLSVALWCDYLNFVQEYDPSVRECSAAGISKARNLFERALTAAGLHVTEGRRIWELYREFEQAIFLTIGENDSGAKEKQTQRIRNLFHRQLSVPLADLKSTLLAYKASEADHESSIDVNSEELEGLSSHVVSGYQKALEMLNARSHLEEQISKKEIDSEKLEEFMTYLKFEHSFGDPARIQILYERAIAQFPVSSELWLEYTKYLDKTFKTARIVRDAYYRATRNCPWVGELWLRYLLSLERSHGSEEELSTVFEKSLLCTFSSFDEYLNIFLARVDGLRRRISASAQVEDGLSYAAIRDIFQLLGSFRVKLGKDLVAARGVWESLLKISGSMLEAWQGYIAWEIEMGHINEARSLYKRCYSKRFPGTGSEDICHSWMRFEREYGSLEDFDTAVHKVTPRLQELQLFRLQQESKDIGPAINERESSRKTTREKRKPPSSSIHEQSPAKRSKNMAQDLKKTKENDKYQPRHAAEASEAAALDVNKAESAGLQESKDKSSKRSVPFDDQCTAFVSNLSLQATDDDLRNFFADVGGVVAVRILKDKFTKKSRGLAYVDFSDDGHLAAAVEKNKQILLGKRLSILKSDPQGRKKAAGRGTRSEHGNAGKRINNAGKTDSQETSKRQNESQAQSSRSRHDEDVQLKGTNTFAVPRNVKPLGWSSRGKPQPDQDEEHEDETPKSNDEFRKMFLKT
ncbi:UNVERIFIED_CONTAM: Squamous cell carcinoma antigen recognized by T-cells 3 [Sesamum latifolium]|uniref:Squamous cell carcinoma antigen recognized by T-cells 3 n=1 Tax=Sesamum latifolium TaxID=2727402 RepID=A0AAW2V1J7_9LAMI